MREIRSALFSTFLLLLCLGIVMIYSSSGVYAEQTMGDGTHFLKRYLVFVFLGSMGTVLCMTFDYRELQKWARPLLLISFVLLILVLIPGIGSMTGGARRWFHLGPINFQPSELTKVVLIIYLADFFARKKRDVGTFFRGFVPIVVVMAALCLLVIKQPDLGNTVLIFSITLVMLFVAGGNLKYIGSIFLAAIPAFVLLVLAAPYRIRRIVIFLDPWADPQGSGFQLTQSQIALGTGGFWGVGLGQSTQKLFYLPAAHTDFIFSIIGEELGFLGVVSVILLFALFLWQGVRLLKRTTDPFGYYLVFGILVMIGIQVVVNMGVSIGALPTKGLPLPFISYGGSALVFNMASVGLLLNVARGQEQSG